MAMLPVIAKLEDVDEKFRSEYREGTTEEGLKGKHVLEVTTAEGWALENVRGLKNSLSAARTERDGFKRQLGEYGEELTPAKVQDLLKQIEELRKGGKSDEVAIEAVKKQLGDKHTAELVEKDKVLVQRDLEISELLIESEATRAITELEGNVTLLLPHVRTKCAIDRSGDKPKAIVLQDDGKTPRLSMKQGNDDNMTVAEFVESLKNDDTFSPAFAGSSATGSGKGDTPGGPRKPTTSQTPTQTQNPPEPTNFVQQFKDQREKEWNERQRKRNVGAA